MPAPTLPARPYVTLGLTAALLASFALTAWSGVAAEAALDEALARFATVRRERPSARLDPGLVVDAPPSLRAALASATLEQARAPTDDDLALARALAEVRAAADRLPAVRFGHQSGDPSWQGVLTHAFVHVRALHLLGNLLGLLLAGVLLERARGSLVTGLALVLGAGLGLVAHEVFAPAAQIPLIGASAAVLGVLGALALGAPTARLGPLPAWSLLLAWGLVELALAPFGLDPHRAHAAHLGGAIGGLLLGLWLRRHTIAAGH